METILILGPLPPPYMGPAIATEIILKSKLKERFHLVHLNTGIHKSIATLGTWRLETILLNAWIYGCLKIKIIRHWPDLVLIPISQTTSGFIKDSFYILICRFFRRRVLLQLRGSNFQNWLHGSGRLTQTYVRWILKKTAGMIVLGENLRDLFTDFYPENRIFVVPNGADYSLEPKAKERDIVSGLFLSNLHSSKGIEDILDAINYLDRQNEEKKFGLEVVGSWCDKQIMESCLLKVKDNKLPVCFHPPKIGKLKFEFYAQADIFIFTPREREGHPWAIIEAMAAGLPIISTDQGAISESVLNGVNGFIVEARNPEAIARKLKILIENPELRQKMGKESRRLYEDKFTEDKMVERLANVFNYVLIN